MNNIKIIIPELSLINNIETPHNYPSKHTLVVTDLGVNIHIFKQYTTTINPVIISNDMTERIPDGSTIDSSHITTLQLPGLSKKARQIHIFPKIITSPQISLEVLYDDGCIVTIEKHKWQSKTMDTR